MKIINLICSQYKFVANKYTQFEVHEIIKSKISLDLLFKYYFIKTIIIITF